jgi:hypothetical protein
LRRLSANATASSTVSDDVAIPGITSTSFMTWAGLKKWMPTTFSGRLRPAAIAEMDNDEVLVARIVFSGHAASNSENTRRLTPRSSNTASMTRSTSPKPE